MGLGKALAVKLLQLYNGERIPASKLNHPLIVELIAEGVIIDLRYGRSKSLLFIPLPASLDDFLFNRFAIANLGAYIDALNQEELSRALLVQHASDSKTKNVRVFKGFLVNCYQPIQAELGGNPIVIYPPAGTFQFIHDFERFILQPDVTVVSVENAENFSLIGKQQYLFKGLRTLFVSRYPQNKSKDLVKWLTGIQNLHLHFGDYDFAGINIYLQEYKRYLGVRTRFFIPPDLEILIARHGNKKIYDSQKANFTLEAVEDPEILQTIALLHKYKKGLEQEALIWL
ncbi:hypothetical protein [Dyadobacter sp. LHD-138]|uniref:DUF7281 domain-containing protein n=1 Tax=Dyadobacter sp. LHD-138 TaxID=3071413 RepID=UPI0027DF91E6|nr:hypothetical protein [Dyadobacter sp. LHD-138]MDQ6482512.1 hypothetical protein [Dyadobacter sp. LHD-138]